MKKILILLIAFISCNSNDKFVLLDLSNSQSLDNSELIIEFNDKHPIGLKLIDTLAFIIEIKSNNCLSAVNIQTKEFINNFGNIGRGPNELQGPSFISEIDRSEVLLAEINHKKIVKINLDDSGLYNVKDYMRYPDVIYPSSELNLSTNYIVGRMVGMQNKMLYIYNKHNDNFVEIDYPLSKNINKGELNYIYAPCIALNEEKNRIITGMYFFDAFHLYDLDGSKLKSFCFSKKYEPNLDSDNYIDEDRAYSSIYKIFPTAEHCYVLRKSIINPGKNESEKFLIKLDWDGKLINSYKIPDDVSGQFYVDEKTNKLYIIKHYLKDEKEEMYAVVAYSLV